MPAIRGRFEILQRMLGGLPCPNCLDYELSFLLRCDLGYGECLQIARCDSCGHALVLNGRFEEAVRRQLEGQQVGPCPRCGSGKTRLGLLCKLASHRPLAVGLCDACRREFSLEAKG